MKLRKQTPAKALIVAATASLFVAFYSLVRSEPRIKAEAGAAPPVDYQRFFAPSSQPGAQEAPPPNPHIRTRAS